ncbi:hypothetical protein APR41_16040 [Salegentibacter salinarum]|uniref:Methionyl-tRNA formyltransferase n=1 Tax=Salegentibacter salinarum TaxID=447422 RepID=A0A2N0TXJ7_9FLAO|nr:formyltransferase family protein [Salegentibacter salinarum]PKD19470.1 hypothetical protein APR41_16040 [Salegentibacter salinarum]SKB91916.1 methionyl-tRNA formyltransferase [Salegentibacter salinarum]
MKVTLFLLNKKGYQSLKSVLIENKLKQLIELVVIARDEGNKEDYYEEIKNLCEANSIPYIDRKDFAKVNTLYSIAIGWKWLLFNIPNLIVFHDSLLPKYRGFAPLPNMLINGENQLAATSLFASERMDEGNIIFQKVIEVDYPLKIKDAINLIAGLYSEIILEILTYVNQAKKLPSSLQDHSKATYSIWRDDEDYFIDWTMGAHFIERFVNAVGFPYDGAKTNLDDEIIRISDVEVIRNFKLELIHPGKILMFNNKRPIVVCGQDAIMIKQAYHMDGKPYQFNKLRKRLK